jgi:hypothetical protein
MTACHHAGRLRLAATALVAGAVMAAGLGLLAPGVVHLEMDGSDAALIEGVHAPERMYARVARWSDGGAHVEWPGQFGVEPVAVEIELAPFFGRGGEQVELTVARRVLRHTIAADWETVRVPVATLARDLVVDIRSEVHRAPSDPRPLGVRLDRVTIVNGSRTTSWVRDGWPSALMLIVVGALAWLAGHWLGLGTDGAWRQGSAVAAVCVVAAGLHAARAWMLTQSGLLLLAGACALCVAVLVLLHRSGAVTRGTALAVAVACAAAWLANALVTSWYFVDVLRLDAWETVALVEHARNGTLRIADLWAPHNEHRPLTGRLVALAAARWSHWNHWWEFAALQAVAAIQVLAIAGYVTAPRRAWRVQPAVLVATAACFCATTHWETWLRGFSIHILLGVLAPSLALLVLCQRASGWVSLALAAIAAVIGQLSFGAGLLVWPIGALVIVLRRQGAWRPHVGAWLILGLVATALYLPGLQVHPGASANLGLTISAAGLLRMAAGVLVTLAMPVYYVPGLFDGGPSAQQAAVITAAGGSLLAWVALVVLRWRQDAAREHAWLFPAALGAFGLGACLLVSAGRVSGGLLAMTASRYLIFAACFWSGLLLLIGLHTDARGGPARMAVRGLAGACIAAIFVASMGALPYMAGERERVRRARLQFLRGDVGAAAVVLYPDPYKLQHMRAVLQHHRLSVFRPGAR